MSLVPRRVPHRTRKQKTLTSITLFTKAATSKRHQLLRDMEEEFSEFHRVRFEPGRSRIPATLETPGVPARPGKFVVAVDGVGEFDLALTQVEAFVAGYRTARARRRPPALEEGETPPNVRICTHQF